MTDLRDIEESERIPEPTRETPDVFVCYAHADASLVYPEIQWLHQHGLGVWYDQGITAGANWRSTIGEALLDANHVVFFVSKRSLASEHCNREINLALDEGKAIVPVYLEDVELTPDLKVGLNRIQALFHDQEGYQERLLSALQRSEVVRTDHKQIKGSAKPRRYLVLGAATAIVLLAAVIYTSNFSYQSIEAPVAEVTLEDLGSIAVLPFVNLSDIVEVGHFAKGLSDSILDELAKTDWLDVASRTATFELAGEGVHLQALADQLEVAYVLEGSIQKINEESRITAQLIRAKDGFHVWSKTYDRSFADGFRMQEEIGNNVAQLARSKLWSDVKRQHPELIDEFQGVDADAIRYFLDSEEEYSMYTLGEGGDIRTALQLMEKAVQIDSDFAYAIEDLAWNYMKRVDPTLSVAESSARAHAAIDRALELNPDSVQALFFLAQIYLNLDLNYASAKLVAERGLELQPEGTWWNSFLAGVAGTEGRVNEAKRLMEMDYQRDHEDDRPDFLLLYSNAVFSLGEYALSLRLSSEALDLVGDARRGEVLLAQARALIGLDRAEEASSLMVEAWELIGAQTPEAFVYLFAVTGKRARALALLSRTEMQRGNRQSFVDGHYVLGNDDEVFDVLREAIQDHDFDVISSMRNELFIPRLRGDARFSEMMALLESKETHTPQYLEAHKAERGR